MLLVEPGVRAMGLERSGRRSVTPAAVCSHQASIGRDAGRVGGGVNGWYTRCTVSSWRMSSSRRPSGLPDSSSWAVHGEDLPVVRDAFEGVDAPVLEGDAGSGHQVFDGSRDEDLVGCG